MSDQEKRKISRRDMIKTTGVVTILGLAYTRPFVETISAKSAFQGYGRNGGQNNRKGNNGVGNGVDPQPPGEPPRNDGPGTGPGNPGNRGGPK